MTTNVAQSLEFYAGLFPEWDIKTIPMGEHTYYKIFVGDLSFGGFVQMEATEAGPRTHWIGYVGVDDCDEMVARCERYGGTTVIPGFEVPNIGKFALIQDPQGAMLKPFELYEPIELPDKPATGHLGWNELHTNDPNASRQFYQSAFGWSAVEKQIPGAGPYTAFRIGELEVAGCLPFPDGVDAPPSWLTYVYADDLEDRAEKTEALGAETYMPPRAVPGIGKFSVHADTNGAAFALYNLE
jgi:predicted enzyme related to lactoylglutathione lyase